MLAIRLNKQNKTIKIVNRSGNTLRIVREDKTVKVVNRRRTLKLTHTGKIGPQGIQGEQGVQGIQGVSIRYQGDWGDSQSYLSFASGMEDVVTHNGSSWVALQDNVGFEPGVAGSENYWNLLASKGDTGYSTFNRAHHGTDANFARPLAQYVEWVGSVAPINATTEDTWIAVIN